MFLFWAMLFGSVGLGFFVYGKRQGAVVPLVVGIALMAFPYFVPDLSALVLVGAILVVLPYFFRD